MNAPVACPAGLSIGMVRPTTRRRAVVATVVSMLAASAWVSAQSPAPVAFHLMTGTVVSDEPLPRPLFRARVSVEWTDGRAGPVFTDASGHFEVPVRADAFQTVTVSKAGYAPQTIRQDGALAPATMDVRLARGAAISGTVVDQRGEPVVASGIKIRRTDPTGTKYAIGEYSVSTDDLGEFRVGSLPAGPYAVLLMYGRSATVVLNGDAEPGSVVRVVGGEEHHLSRVVERAETTTPTSVTPPAASASLPSPGLRDSPRAATGVISGRIKMETSRAPLATVVMAMELSGKTATAKIAGSDGRFELGALPPGSYKVIVNAGSTSTMVDLTRPGPTVTLLAGQRVTVDVTLPARSAVSGTVTDEYGEPVEGILVEAWRVPPGGGRVGSPLAPRNLSRRTDDRGRYRLFDLGPGSYYVVAVETAGTETLRRAFYPATYAIAEATTVSVESGRDAYGIDVAMSGDPLGVVQGRVLTSDGAPYRGSVTLEASAAAGVPTGPQRAAEVVAGSFQFRGVSPGRYLVRAQAGAPSGTGAMQSGSSIVTVSGGGVADATILMSPLHTLRGRLVVTAGAARPANLEIRVLAADAERSVVVRPSTTVRQDGTFTIENVSGPIRIGLTGFAGGWRLVSALVNGVNAADEPVTIGEGSRTYDDVELVLARGGAEVSGQVETSGAGAALVVVFAADPLRWHVGSRFFKVSTTDANGRFTAADLPGGQYLVAAVPAADVDAGSELEHAGVLSRLAATARSATVAEGGRAIVNPRLMSLPR